MCLECHPQTRLGVLATFLRIAGHVFAPRSHNRRTKIDSKTSEHFQEGNFALRQRKSPATGSEPGFRAFEALDAAHLAWTPRPNQKTRVFAPCSAKEKARP
jgi:hypothetical protein